VCVVSFISVLSLESTRTFTTSTSSSHQGGRKNSKIRQPTGKTISQNVKAEIPRGFGNADDWVISATLENWDKY